MGQDTAAAIVRLAATSLQLTVTKEMLAELVVLVEAGAMSNAAVQIAVQAVLKEDAMAMGAIAATNQRLEAMPILGMEVTAQVGLEVVAAAGLRLEAAAAAGLRLEEAAAGLRLEEAAATAICLEELVSCARRGQRAECLLESLPSSSSLAARSGRSIRRGGRCWGGTPTRSST